MSTLPSAIRVDEGDITRMSSIAQTHRKLFLICRSGRRSLIATNALAKAGIDNVWNVTGGMLALRATAPAALEEHGND